jgi:hypothetical protein
VDAFDWIMGLFLRLFPLPLPPHVSRERSSASFPIHSSYHTMFFIPTTEGFDNAPPCRPMRVQALSFIRISIIFTLANEGIFFTLANEGILSFLPMREFFSLHQMRELFSLLPMRKFFFL